MKPISIVIADDHALMREGTRRILEQHPDLVVVGEADNGRQALEVIERLQPDVAILDIRMPEVSGVEVVRQIKVSCPHTKSLIFTAYDDDDYILALMEAGAAGYLLKTAKEGELIDSIRKVHLGESVLHPAIAMKVARLWAQRGFSTKQTPADQLSPRELEVLGLAAKGLRNKAIAKQLSISVRTVEGHFTNIFVKMNVTSRIEAILYAVSRHLVALEEQDST